MTLLEVKLSALAYGGDALGRLPDGRMAFVPFALPGEIARVRPMAEKRGHVRGELVEILQAAPERITPTCRHFGMCGGCHYQHLAYPDQLTAKTAILREQLERIGGLKEPTIGPAVPSPQPFYYRNHVQFHLTPQGKLGYTRAQLGAASANDPVFAIQECCLPETAINAVWPQLDFEVIPGLERIGLRLGVEDDLQLILESSEVEAPEFNVEGMSLSAVHLGPAGALVLAGSPSVSMQITEKQFTRQRLFQVSAGSFFQVNTSLAECMVSHILKYLAESSLLSVQTTVLDVYCGVGLFSAFLAEHVGRVVGIEASPSACEDFTVNLDEFDHVELYEATAEEVLPRLSLIPQVVLVDPPRAGIGQRALDGLLALQAPTLIYISCDPATLARDARRLAAGGYHLHQITPFDLFPQTYHIESISIWNR